LWIIVHDMEAGEFGGRAESTAAYFANPGDGREVSSHYVADNNSVVQCVDLDNVAWTVGNRPGNYRGINWEFSGFASQGRSDWLDPFGLAMFYTAAPLIRADAARFHIPLTRRTVAELKAGKPGITSHNDLREAFGVTTHTDPGPGFPWDTFLKIINNEEDDTMTPAEFAQILKDPKVRAALADLLRIGQDPDGTYIMWRTEAIATMRDPTVIHLPSGSTVSEPNGLARILRSLEASEAASLTRDAAALAAIRLLGSGGTNVDTAAIIAAVKAEAETTRQLVSVLRAENAELQARLADALAGPAVPPAPTP
jgi:N-acetyl-anhydromuramyl-L-alanine amidase AmpD